MEGVSEVTMYNASWPVISLPGLISLMDEEQ
jgi:hypothetical protein